MSISRYQKLMPLASRALMAHNSRLLCVPLAAQQQNIDINRALSDAAKYPWQQWGYKYLFAQKSRGRPISPHLTIYGNDWSWTISGAHRIFGCALGIGAAVVCMGLAVLPFDWTAVIETLRSLGIPSPIWGIVKFVVAFMITFHTINGFRFLGMDRAKFMNNNAQIVLGAKGVLGASLIIAFFVGFVAPMMK